MKRALVRTALLSALSLGTGSLVVRSAWADDRRVVVLMARGAPHQPWPEATQAVIAELAARNYQVMVESSEPADLAALLEELKTGARRPETVAAVAVVRDGNTGVAYVWTLHDANVVQVTADPSAGAVAEGALALRVTELVRAREQLAASPPPAEPAKPRAEREQPSQDDGSSQRDENGAAPEHDKPPLLIWLGGGPTFAAGAGAPLVAASAGLRVPLGLSKLGLDMAAAISVTPLRLATTAGDVEIATRQATLHLMFDPWSKALLNFAVGAGLGGVWLDQNATAAPGYEATADEAIVALASIRARGAVQSGNVSFVLALEPGLLFPAASVMASDQELLRIGRPWTTITAGFGWLIR